MKSAFLVPFLLLTQTAFPQQASEDYDNLAISKTLERAEIDFYNAQMYKDQQGWVGKTVVIYGSILAKPVILPEKKEYIQISGSSNSGEPVNVVAYLDSPLPTPRNVADQSPTVSKGVPLRIFGVLQKCRDLVDQSGYVRYLPAMECLLIYAGDDRSYTHPLWASQFFKRRR
jgi:hypothetical protein